MNSMVQSNSSLKAARCWGDIRLIRSLKFAVIESRLKLHPRIFTSLRIATLRPCETLSSNTYSPPLMCLYCSAKQCNPIVAMQSKALNSGPCGQTKERRPNHLSPACRRQKGTESCRRAPRSSTQLARPRHRSEVARPGAQTQIAITCLPDHVRGSKTAGMKLSRFLFTFALIAVIVAFICSHRYFVFNGTYDTMVITTGSEAHDDSSTQHSLVKFDTLTGKVWAWNELTVQTSNGVEHVAHWIALTNTSR